jgi:hypothetical protein
MPLWVNNIHTYINQLYWYVLSYTVYAGYLRSVSKIRVQVASVGTCSLNMGFWTLNFSVPAFSKKEVLSEFKRPTCIARVSTILSILAYKLNVIQCTMWLDSFAGWLHSMCSADTHSLEVANMHIIFELAYGDEVVKCRVVEHTSWSPNFR